MPYPIAPGSKQSSTASGTPAYTIEKRPPSYQPTSSCFETVCVSSLLKKHAQVPRLCETIRGNIGRERVPESGGVSWLSMRGQMEIQNGPLLRNLSSFCRPEETLDKCLLSKAASTRLAKNVLTRYVPFPVLGLLLGHWKRLRNQNVGFQKQVNL